VTSEITYLADANTVVMNLDACTTGFSYLWNETPVLGTEALPIYADDEFWLPAAPWKYPVFSRESGSRDPVP
jgi:hypothetical protein